MPITLAMTAGMAHMVMEESISKAAEANFGEYVSPGEFRAMIRTIGRIPYLVALRP